MKVTQGDTIARTMTFTDKVTGDPYDLSIYTAIKMQVRKRPNTDVIADGSMLAGNFEISGTGSNILNISGISIPNSTPIGTYLYDIEFSNEGSGIKETLISGNITITAQITL